MRRARTAATFGNDTATGTAASFQTSFGFLRDLVGLLHDSFVFLRNLFVFLLEVFLQLLDRLVFLL